MNPNPPRVFDINQLYQIAVGHHQKGDLQTAMELYRLILAQHPDLPAVQCNLGLALTMAEDHANALCHLTKAVELAPDFPEAFFNLGNVYNRLAQPEKALAAYHQALALKKSYPEAANNIRITLLNLANAPQALACKEHMIETAAALPDSWFYLGNALNRLQQPEAAAFCFERAAALTDEPMDALNNLGLTLHSLGRRQEAIACFQKLIIRHPDYKIAHINLETVLRESLSPPEMIHCYQEILAASPADAEAHFQMAGNFLKIGEYTGAQTLFQRIPDLDPDFGLARLRNIRIETSSACNLRCRHCPTGNDYHSIGRTVMEESLFNRILAEIRRIPSIHQCILYLSGEPLLNKALPEMCRRLKAETHITHVQFNTNAMLVTESLCRSLAHAGVDHIGISIDGRSPEENNRIRRGSDYHTVVKHVAMLRKYLQNTRISIDNTIIKRPGDPLIPEPPAFLQQDFPDLPIESIYAMKWPGLDIKTVALKNLRVSADKAQSFCPMPFTQLAVRVNGDIVFCCYDLAGESRVGNILDQDLMEIWGSPVYRNLRRHILRYEQEALPPICRKCIMYNGEILVAEE